jgi:hypothetical protein
MKKWLTLSVLTLVGCGPAGESEGAFDENVSVDEQAVTNAWVGPVGGNRPGWPPIPNPTSVTCGGTPNVGATAARCAASYCGQLSLYCSGLPFTTNGTDMGWTGFISEEGGNAAMCPGTSVVDGIRVSGANADNVSIHCTGVNWPSISPHCRWTPWFSEEQGTQSFFAGFTTGAALAVRCRGSYCDDMQYFVCEPGCNTRADCNGGNPNGPNACVSGPEGNQCVIG